MSEFWNRYVELQVANKVFTLDEYDIEFEVENSDSMAGQSEIAIWNLGESKNIFKTGELIQLKAGYKDDFGIIFYGKIDKLRQEKDGADVKTTAICSDLTKMLFEKKKVFKIYREGTAINSIIQELLSESGIPVGKLEDPKIKLEKQMVFGGNPESTVYNVIQHEIIPFVNGKSDKKYKFYIGVDGLAYFVDENFKDATAIVLESESGLMDVYDVSDETVKFRVKCLLNWKIRQNIIVQIRSFAVNGNFKVLKFKHVCNRENYYTEAEVVPI